MTRWLPWAINCNGRFMKIQPSDSLLTTPGGVQVTGKLNYIGRGHMATLPVLEHLELAEDSLLQSKEFFEQDDLH